MTCTVVVASPAVVVIQCTGDLEAQWHEFMALQCEQEWEEEEARRVLEDCQAFQHKEAGFNNMRLAVDPYWPPRDLPDWFEVAEPDPALAGYELTPYHLEASL